MDPPVSEPRAAKHSPAATAAQEPPEEPPGTCSVSHGFFVTANAEVSVVLPIANSSMFVFPRITMPASVILVTAVAS